MARAGAKTDTTAYAFYEDALPDWGIDSILIAEDEQGDIYYPVRAMCDALGVARWRQAGIIQADTRTQPGARDIAAPTRGGKQPALYLRQHETAIWLALIDPARVGKRDEPDALVLTTDTNDLVEDKARDKLLALQDALWALADRAAFKRRKGADASAANPTSVARLSGGVAHAETACPDCGAPLVAEVEGDQLRLTRK